jgi:two-component system chemotaxis response regulator CheY
MKMLIVDDSKAMRGFLTHLATGMDFVTTEAEDGRAALDTLIRTEAKERFDVALVDWDMPRMNGLEFVQFVRRNRAYDGLKLMMVTTSSSPEKVAAALAAGANDYLMKPVTRESLAEKLVILGLLS